MSDPATGPRCSRRKPRFRRLGVARRIRTPRKPIGIPAAFMKAPSFGRPSWLQCGGAARGSREPPLIATAYRFNTFKPWLADMAALDPVPPPGRHSPFQAPDDRSPRLAVVRWIPAAGSRAVDTVRSRRCSTAAGPLGWRKKFTCVFTTKHDTKHHDGLSAGPHLGRLGCRRPWPSAHAEKALLCWRPERAPFAPRAEPKPLPGPKRPG